MPIREHIKTRVTPVPSYNYAIRFFTAPPSMVRSSYTQAYSITEGTYLDSLRVNAGTALTLYFVLHKSTETVAGTYKYTQLLDDSNPKVVFDINVYKDGLLLTDYISLYFTNFYINWYNDRSGQWQPMGSHIMRDSSSLPLRYPDSRYDGYKQSFSSGMQVISYLNFLSQYLDPHQMGFTPQTTGVYDFIFSLKECSGGTDRAGIYQPSIINRKYGPLAIGYGGVSVSETVLARNRFTLIVG